MENSTIAISVRGKPVAVPCYLIENTPIIVSGSFLRVAVIHDEEWLPANTLPPPLKLVEAIRQSGIKADVFSFAQRIPDTTPKFPFPMEEDNAAIITIKSYKDWWDALPQVARRNVRTAEKKGIEFRLVPFDDELVEGIRGIYNETPVRLGKPFWHYGKDHATVKAENGTYADRSDFIGAFLEGKLIGFIKLVHIDHIGSMMQILSMFKHQDKRTTNGLIAKAVEVCATKGRTHLMYCQYVYDENESSLLTDFKKRNGFERVNFPKYYVPLTAKGRLAVALGAQRGIKGMLPKPVLSFALHVRARYYNFRQRKNPAAAD